MDGSLFGVSDDVLEEFGINGIFCFSSDPNQPTCIEFCNVEDLDTRNILCRDAFKRFVHDVPLNTYAYIHTHADTYAVNL